jgi:hypothetical protein
MNSWTAASTEIKRSVFFDDFAYASSPHTIHVQDTRAMGTDLVTLGF